jgi:hypothetical protein
MNKLYGYSIILISGIVILIFGSMWFYGAYKVIFSATPQGWSWGVLIQPLIFILPSALFMRRGLAIAKEQVLIIAPESKFSSAFFYFGGLLLAVAIVGICISFFLLAQVFITKSYGARIGMGVGLSIFPFILGACLIEMCKRKAS